MKDNELKIYLVTATRPAYVTHTYAVRAINEGQAEAQALGDIRLGMAEEVIYRGAEFIDNEVIIDEVKFDRYVVPSDVRAFDYALVEQAEEN